MSAYLLSIPHYVADVSPPAFRRHGSITLIRIVTTRSAWHWQVFQSRKHMQAISEHQLPELAKGNESAEPDSVLLPATASSQLAAFETITQGLVQVS